MSDYIARLTKCWLWVCSGDCLHLSFVRPAPLRKSALESIVTSAIDCSVLSRKKGAPKCDCDAQA